MNSIESDPIDLKQMADAFNGSLAEFLKHVDKDTFPFEGVTDDMKVLKAFVVAHNIDGKDTINKLTKISGLDQMGHGIPGLDVEKHLEIIAMLPLDKLLNGATDAEVLRKELASTFNKLGSDSFNIAKGASNQLFSLINDALVDNASVVTSALEKRVVIEVVNSTGDKFSKRVYDRVIKKVPGGEEIFIENKGWKPSYLREGLRRAFSFEQTVKVDGTGGADKVGQMLSDIVSYQHKKGVFNMQWRFSPEMADEDVLGTMMELMEGDDMVRDNLKRALRLDNDELKTFLNNFEDKAVTQGLFKTEKYDNIVAALDAGN